jgi:hypothetical protein
MSYFSELVFTTAFSLLGKQSICPYNKEKKEEKENTCTEFLTSAQSIIQQNSAVVSEMAKTKNGLNIFDIQQRNASTTQQINIITFCHSRCHLLLIKLRQVVRAEGLTRRYISNLVNHKTISGIQALRSILTLIGQLS